MATIRIYELAKELEKEPKRIIEDLQREGVDVSVPSDNVSEELANKIRDKHPKIKSSPRKNIQVITRTITENLPITSQKTEKDSSVKPHKEVIIVRKKIQSTLQNDKEQYNKLPDKNSEVTKSYTSDNENLRVYCLKCHTSTKHDLIHLSKASDVELIEEYQIIQCFNCESFSFRKIIIRNQSVNEMTVDLYPNRIIGRKKLQLEYIPPTIAQMYNEIHSALSSNLLIVATSGMRTLIELVCNDQNSEAKNLMSKIDDLVERKLLTLKNAKNLHKLRDYGNEAAHEANIQAEVTLYRCMDIIEHLLKDIYLPEIYD